ncbi:uncharacterized protein LOC132602362 [Lycium barbarum]|uniref:uncharacterized protein LOC132602362 n=1 Tax=Lycium barbarum TaxID=112863 RepID=UPI00293E9241|nr:uncharacterized protein LOC132602362 [Lycium barbarum]
MKTGIGSAIAGSSYHRCMLLNCKEWKSDSSQVAEIEKQNCNDEESLVGGRSSKTINHSTRDFQRSPANTHEITNKLKGIAGGQNSNKETQVLGCANQEVTLGSTDSEK